MDFFKVLDKITAGVTLKNLTVEPAAAQSTQTTKIAKAVNDGVIVGFFLSPTDAQTIFDFATTQAGLSADMVTPVDLMHITVSHIGDTSELAEDIFQSPRALADSLQYGFGQYQLPVVGKTTGIGLFDPVTITDENGQPVKKRPLVILFDSPQLPELWDDLEDCLESHCGLETSSNHGFIPHITVAYLPDTNGATIPEAFYKFPALSMLFQNITLAWGDARFDIELEGKPEPEEMYEGNDDSFGYGVYAYPKEVQTSSKFFVKEINGEYRFFVFSSSAYQDKDGEWVTRESLELDCLRADLTGEYGPLLWWHDKSLVLGEVDYNDVFGNILVESGSFKSADIAKAVQSISDELGVSIGFKGWRNPADPKAFVKTHRQERSLLPKEKASNWLTATAVVKKGINVQMPTMQEKMQRFVDSLKSRGYTDEQAKGIVSQITTEAGGLEKAAETIGLTAKETGGGNTAAETQPAATGITAEVLKEVLAKFGEALMQTVDDKIATVAGEQTKKEEGITAQLATITATLTTLTSQIATLSGEAPAIVKNAGGAGVRPSQSAANTIADAAVKQALATDALTDEQKEALTNPFYKMARDLVANTSPLIR